MPPKLGSNSGPALGTHQPPRASNLHPNWPNFASGQFLVQLEWQEPSPANLFQVATCTTVSFSGGGPQRPTLRKIREVGNHKLTFQVPMFTSTGLRIRFLKVHEKSGYQPVKWVRYLTCAGDDYEVRVSH